MIARKFSDFVLFVGSHIGYTDGGGDIGNNVDAKLVMLIMMIMVMTKLVMLIMRMMVMMMWRKKLCS